jgi:hypothetical protein
MLAFESLTPLKTTDGTEGCCSVRSVLLSGISDSIS